MVKTFKNWHQGDTRRLVVEDSQGERRRIDTTDEHPFYVKDKGWVNANQLLLGDKIITQEQAVELTLVANESSDQDYYAYDLTVDDYHTYFVSDKNALVHNCGGKGSGKGSTGDAAKSAGNFTRKISASDLGVKGNLKELRGSFSVNDGVATARIDMIRGEIKNPLEIVNNLANTARNSGANTLRIEGTLANERLFNVLSKRYGLTSNGAADVITIPLQ